MKAVILVPYRPDGAERDRNWRIARLFWATLGIPIVEGNTPGRDFQRAQARNVAAAEAGEWEVAMFVDADIILGSRAQAWATLKRSHRTGAYTVAYSQLNYLTDRGVRQLDGGKLPRHCEIDEHVGLTWECCFAVRRDFFDKVGGFDERFKGWGGQVAAFFYAYATFGGRQRIPGHAYHLAHPLVNRWKDPHFTDNVALAEQYRRAVDDPRAMTQLLAAR